ncbi:hypothetical protein GF324_13440 [bacterium]|nr:hypothetical protein [bacterium]
MAEDVGASIFRLRWDLDELVLEEYLPDGRYVKRADPGVGIPPTPLAASHPELSALLGETMKKIRRGWLGSNHTLNIALTPPWGYAWLLEPPSMNDEEELEDFILWELENHVEGDLDDYIYAWQPLGDQVYAIVIRPELLGFWNKLAREHDVSLGQITLQAGLADGEIEESADLLALYKLWRQRQGLSAEALPDEKQSVAAPEPTTQKPPEKPPAQPGPETQQQGPAPVEDEADAFQELFGGSEEQSEPEAESVPSETSSKSPSDSSVDDELADWLAHPAEMPDEKPKAKASEPPPMKTVDEELQDWLTHPAEMPDQSPVSQAADPPPPLDDEAESSDDLHATQEATDTPPRRPAPVDDDDLDDLLDDEDDDEEVRYKPKRSPVPLIIAALVIVIAAGVYFMKDRIFSESEPSDQPIAEDTTEVVPEPETPPSSAGVITNVMRAADTLGVRTPTLILTGDALTVTANGASSNIDRWANTVLQDNGILEGSLSGPVSASDQQRAGFRLNPADETGMTLAQFESLVNSLGLKVLDHGIVRASKDDLRELFEAMASSRQRPFRLSAHDNGMGSYHVVVMP